MIVQGLVFYLFATITVASAAMVITVRNPVNSVLFLILAFFNAAGLFVLLGAEYLAMLLVIVYVGAVAVLFLFVVMMLNIDVTAMKQGFVKSLPVAFLVGVVFVVELIMVLGGVAQAPKVTGQEPVPQMPIPPLDEASNIESIGRFLYTDGILLFQTAGMILLLAMVGAIVLTLRHRKVRRQSIHAQVSRTVEETVKMVKIPSGGGA